MTFLKKCPYCHDAWIYASVGDYGSGYENLGYRIECRCGFAWKSVDWVKAKEEAIDKWNAYLEE